MSARGPRRLALAAALVALGAGALELAARTVPGAFGAAPDAVRRCERLYASGSGFDLEERAFVGYGRPRGAAAQDAAWGAKAPGVVRVAWLGEWPGDPDGEPGADGSEAARLGALLDARAAAAGLALAFEVDDRRVPGWTSAESLMDWFLAARHGDPDVVVVELGLTDVEPRLRTGFRGDYSHYRKRFEPPRAGALERWLGRRSRAALLLRARGGFPDVDACASLPAAEGPVALDPGGAAAFRRNLESVVGDARSAERAVVLATVPPRPASPTDAALRSRGAAEHADVLRRIAGERGCGLADLERAPRDDRGQRAEQLADAIARAYAPLAAAR